MAEAVPRSVGRVLDVLEFVVAEGKASLTAVANATELTPTTALRHLRALDTRGYVRRAEDGRFSAGPTLKRISLTMFERSPSASLVETAQPILTALAKRTGESAYLAVQSGSRAVYLATAESDRAIRHVGWVGRSVPIRNSAIGEALRGLDGARVRRGAVEADITAVAHAVRVDGAVVGALSVIGPQHRMGRSVMTAAGRELTNACTELAAQLASHEEAP
jgi:IclR family transcriptional regulator, acetate operon repressor